MIKNLQSKVLLLIGLLIAGVSAAWADNYVKVTSTEDITDGQYLIVYETGSTAFNGGLETLDAINNEIAVTISNGVIAASQETEAAEFTLDVENGTILSASGQYIGVSSNSNGLKQTDNSEAYTHTFSINDDNDAVIAAVFQSSTMTLRYNKASNQNRFRYYKSGQEPIQLYKKVSSGPVDVTLSFAETEPEVTLTKNSATDFEATYTQTVTANPAAYNGTVTYSIDEENSTIGENTIAEVDENGTVTIVAGANEASTIVVKATGAAVEDKYNAPAAVSYTLTVNKALEGVATPTFSLEAGAYYYGTKVEVEATNATLITYTTDGTEPTIDSANYPDGGITITQSMTIKVKGFDEDFNESEVASLTVTLKAPEAPTFSVAAGEVKVGTTVTITAGEGGDLVAVTTDGTDPTADDITDELTITLNEAMTIKAATVDDGGNLSEIVTAAYTVFEVHELTLDFEEETTSDWVTENLSRDNEGINAHTGN